LKNFADTRLAGDKQGEFWRRCERSGRQIHV